MIAPNVAANDFPVTAPVPPYEFSHGDRQPLT
jgi:hypothetical protein